MGFLINLMNLLAKYKWIIIVSIVTVLWGSSLWMMHSHDVKVCEDSKSTAIVEASTKQDAFVKVSDENLQKSKLVSEKVRQSDREVITKYIERTKDETTVKCSGNFSIGTDNTSMYNNLGSPTAKDTN